MLEWLGRWMLPVAALGLAGCAAYPRLAPVDMDAREQAETVLARLSVGDKLALTHGSGTMTVAANPAKGIPEELVFSDGPHTVRAEMSRRTFAYRYDAEDPRDTATVFPALSALAQTWDVDLARRFGEALGEEARARGKDVLLGPGLNIARTPLCGRNYEYLGEDPCLAAHLAVPIVQGIQSRDVAACVKHFAANNQELNRNHVDARPSIRTLREIYLPAFEAAVKEGGALCVMNGYNSLYGWPCSHNSWLNNTILKKEWGFPGLVVSDWGSLQDTVSGALGGTDLEMNAGDSIRHFKGSLGLAVRAGVVPQERLDDMARRVLYVQAKLHKLDGGTRAEGAIHTPEHRALAREIGAASVTLLKNDAGLLPLQEGAVRRMLVVGAAADSKVCREGWSAEGKPPYEITLLAGLRVAFPKAIITHEPFPMLPNAFAAIPDSCLLTENPNRLADTGMLDRGWVWQRFADATLTGVPLAEGFARTPGIPEALSHADRFTVRWRTTLRAPERGVYTFCVTCDDGARFALDGVPLLDAWQDGARRRVVVSVYLEAGRDYALTLDHYQAGGEAVLAFGWQRPSERGVSYEALLAEAKRADVVILATGNRKGHGPALECEGADRPSLDLLPQDNAAIERLLGVNPRTIVVVQAGAPVLMPWVDRAETLVQHSFLGQESGRAVADVLAGKREPMGRLIHTWPRTLGDSPAHALDDYRDTVVYHREGILVGYRWFDAKGLLPLFPFGYGLSYADFDYGIPEVSVRDWGVKVSVEVTNIAERSGTAVVQLYVEPPEGSLVLHAPRQLAAFQKVFLEPGDTERLTFEVPHRAFAHWSESLPGWQHERGIFTIAIGNSSRDLPVRAPAPLPAWSDSQTE